MKTAAFCIALVILASIRPVSSQGQTNAKYDSTIRQMMARLNKAKPSISPADSAAAIKGFMNASGGSGLFYQYQTTEELKTKKPVTDTMSVSYCEGGYSRVDFGGFMGRGSAIIGHVTQRKYSVTLNPENKTYLFNIVDTAALNRSNTTYQVTKVGNETAQGYSCIHFKLTMSTGNSTPIVEDIWTSKDVQGYSEMSKMMALRGITYKMLEAIEQAGCMGSFVKLTMQTKEVSMNMVLVTADRRSFPASTFEIPPGYTQASYYNPMLRAAGH